jgi:hypothetical protein
MYILGMICISLVNNEIRLSYIYWIFAHTVLYSIILNFAQFKVYITVDMFFIYSKWKYSSILSLAFSLS